MAVYNQKYGTYTFPVKNGEIIKAKVSYIVTNDSLVTPFVSAYGTKRTAQRNSLTLHFQVTCNVEKVNVTLDILTLHNEFTRTFIMEGFRLIQSVDVMWEYVTWTIQSGTCRQLRLPFTENIRGALTTPYKNTDNFIFMLTQPKHVSRTFSVSLKGVPTNVLDEKMVQNALSSCENLFVSNFTLESALTPKKSPGRKKTEGNVSDDEQSIIDTIMGVEYIYSDDAQQPEEMSQKISKRDILSKVIFKFIKLKVTEDGTVFTTDFEGCLASGFKEKKERVRKLPTLPAQIKKKK